MFCISSPNNTQFYQKTNKPENKHPMGLNPLNFIIGQALRISLTAFTYQEIRKEKPIQTEGKLKTCQIIQIESDQNIEFPEEKNLRRHSQTEKEETKSREQVPISQQVNKIKPESRKLIVKQRVPAENLNTFEKVNDKIIEVQLPENKMHHQQMDEQLCQLAVLPQFGVSIQTVEKKLENLLMRQVTDWKQISKKQKRQIRKLKL